MWCHGVFRQKLDSWTLRMACLVYLLLASSSSGTRPAFLDMRHVNNRAESGAVYIWRGPFQHRSGVEAPATPNWAPPPIEADPSSGVALPSARVVVPAAGGINSRSRFTLVVGGNFSLSNTTYDDREAFYIFDPAKNQWLAHYQTHGITGPSFALEDLREAAGCYGVDASGSVVFLVHGGVISHARTGTPQIRVALPDGEPHDASLILTLDSPSQPLRSASYVDNEPEVLPNPQSRNILQPSLEGPFPFDPAREWLGKRAGHAMVSVPEINSCVSLGGYGPGGGLLGMDLRSYDFGVAQTNSLFGEITMFDPSGETEGVHPFSGTVGSGAELGVPAYLLDVRPAGRRSMCAVYARRDQSLIVFGGVGNGTDGEGYLLGDAWKLRLLDESSGSLLPAVSMQWQSATPARSPSAPKYSHISPFGDPISNDSRHASEIDGFIFERPPPMAGMGCAYDEDLNRVVVVGGLTCSKGDFSFPPEEMTEEAILGSLCRADAATEESRAVYFLELGWHDKDVSGGVGRPGVIPDETYWRRWEAAGGVPHWWKMPVSYVTEVDAGSPNPLALRGAGLTLIANRPYREMMVIQNTVAWERNAASEAEAGPDGIGAAEWPDAGSVIPHHFISMDAGRIVFPEVHWLLNPMILKGSYDYGTDGQGGFVGMGTVLSGLDYNVGSSTDANRAAQQMIATGAALAGLSPTGTSNRYVIVRASPSVLRDKPNDSIRSGDSSGSITVRTRNVVNGKINADVALWFGHSTYTRPEEQRRDQSFAVERYFAGTDYYTVDLLDHADAVLSSAVVRYGRGGECTETLTSINRCIPSAYTYYDGGSIDVAVCVGAGSNGLGRFTGANGKAYCAADVDDVCALFDRPVEGSLRGESTLCPAPHTNCFSASRLGRQSFTMADWGAVFNVTGELSSILPPEVLVEPVSQTGYVCLCDAFTDTVPNAVWNESSHIASSFEHIGRPRSHIPMPTCVASESPLPLPVLASEGTGLVSWAGPVQEEPTTEALRIASSLPTGVAGLLSVNDSDVWAVLVPYDMPSPNGTFRPLVESRAEDEYGSRVYCALVNAEDEASLRNGLKTAWPSNELDGTPLAIPLEDGATFGGELSLPVVPMWPCWGFNVTNATVPNVTLSGVSKQMLVTRRVPVVGRPAIMRYRKASSLVGFLVDARYGSRSARLDCAVGAASCTKLYVRYREGIRMNFWSALPDFNQVTGHAAAGRPWNAAPEHGALAVVEVRCGLPWEGPQAGAGDRAIELEDFGTSGVDFDEYFGTQCDGYAWGRRLLPTDPDGRPGTGPRHVVRFGETTGSFGIFARAIPAVGARYTIPEELLPGAAGGAVAWRMVEVEYGTARLHLPAPRAVVELVGHGLDPQSPNDTFRSADSNATLEVLPVELNTRFIPGGVGAPISGNYYYASSEAAAMASAGESMPVVKGDELELLCLARYYPVDEAFESPNDEEDWKLRAGVPRVNVSALLPYGASIQYLVPLPQDLSTDGLQGYDVAGSEIDGGSAFACGSFRIRGDSTAGLYLDLVRLAASIAHRKQYLAVGSIASEVGQRIAGMAGSVDGPLINEVYQKRQEDAQREYGRLETLSIVDTSADERLSGRLADVGSHLLRPGLWVLRVGVQLSTDLTGASVEFSPNAVPLLVYARLPTPVVAEPMLGAQAWTKQPHPTDAGASIVAANGGPISISDPITTGDYGLMIGVDTPGFGPATINGSLGNQGDSQIEVFAPTSRHGFAVPFAVEPTAFEMQRQFGTSDQDRMAPAVEYYCTLDGSVPQRPPRFAGRARTELEEREGWFRTDILGARSEAASLPAPHHSHWDVDADMKLLWSGGLDYSGTSLYLSVNGSIVDTPEKGPTQWYTHGSGTPSMWVTPRHYLYALERWNATRPSPGNSSWAKVPGLLTGSTPGTAAYHSPTLIQTRAFVESSPSSEDPVFAAAASRADAKLAGEGAARRQMFEEPRITKGSFFCGSSIDQARAWASVRIGGAGTPVSLRVVAYPASDRSLAVHGSPPATVSVFSRPRLPAVSKFDPNQGALNRLMACWNATGLLPPKDKLTARRVASSTQFCAAPALQIPHTELGYIDDVRFRGGMRLNAMPLPITSLSLFRAAGSRQINSALNASAASSIWEQLQSTDVVPTQGIPCALDGGYLPVLSEYLVYHVDDRTMHEAMPYGMLQNSSSPVGASMPHRPVLGLSSGYVSPPALSSSHLHGCSPEDSSQWRVGGLVARRDESVAPQPGKFLAPGVGMWSTRVSAPDLFASEHPMCPPVVEVVAGQQSPLDGESYPYFYEYSGDTVMSRQELNSVVADFLDMPRGLVASSDGSKVVFASVLDLYDRYYRYPPLRAALEVPVFGSERPARAQARPMSSATNWAADLLQSEGELSEYDLKAYQLSGTICSNANAGSSSFSRSSSCNILQHGVQISEMVRVGTWIFASAINNNDFFGHELYYAKEDEQDFTLAWDIDGSTASSVPTELTIVEGVQYSQRKHAVCFRARSSSTYYRGDGARTTHSEYSVYCVLVGDLTGSSPDLVYVRYEPNTEQSSGDYIPHDLIAVGPDLVFVMSARSEDTAVEARNAALGLRDGVYSAHRIHIAKALEGHLGATTGASVDLRSSALLRQLTSASKPFLLPVLPGDLLHEEAVVTHRYQVAFDVQYFSDSWRIDRLLGTLSTVVTGKDPWGRDMEPGTGLGGGLVFTGLVDMGTTDQTTIRPALLFFTGESGLHFNRQLESDSVWRSLGATAAGQNSESSQIAHLSSNTVQVLVYLDDVMASQGGDILSRSRASAPLVSASSPRYYTGRSVSDDGARLSSTLPYVVEFPFVILDEELYYLQGETRSRSVGYVGDEDRSLGGTPESGSWRPSRLVASRASRQLSAPFGIVDRFTAIPVTRGVLNTSPIGVQTYDTSGVTWMLRVNDRILFDGYRHPECPPSRSLGGDSNRAMYARLEGIHSTTTCLGAPSVGTRIRIDRSHRPVVARNAAGESVLLAVVRSGASRDTFPEIYWPMFAANITRRIGRSSSRLGRVPEALAGVANVAQPFQTGNVLVQFDFGCSGRKYSLRYETTGSGHSFAPASAPKKDAIGRQLGKLLKPHDQVLSAATEAYDPTQNSALFIPKPGAEYSSWPRLPRGALLPSHPIRLAVAEDFPSVWDGVVAGSKGLLRSTLVDGYLAGSIVKSATVASYNAGSGDVELAYVMIQTIRLLAVSPSIPVDVYQQTSLQIPPIRGIIPVEPTFYNALRRSPHVVLVPVPRIHEEDQTAFGLEADALTAHIYLERHLLRDMTDEEVRLASEEIVDFQSGFDLVSNVPDASGYAGLMATDGCLQQTSSNCDCERVDGIALDQLMSELHGGYRSALSNDPYGYVELIGTIRNESEYVLACTLPAGAQTRILVTLSTGDIDLSGLQWNDNSADVYDFVSDTNQLVVGLLETSQGQALSAAVSQTFVSLQLGTSAPRVKIFMNATAKHALDDKIQLGPEPGTSGTVIARGSVLLMEYDQLARSAFRVLPPNDTTHGFVAAIGCHFYPEVLSNPNASVPFPIPPNGVRGLHDPPQQQLLPDSFGRYGFCGLGTVLAASSRQDIIFKSVSYEINPIDLPRARRGSIPGETTRQDFTFPVAQGTDVFVPVASQLDIRAGAQGQGQSYDGNRRLRNMDVVRSKSTYDSQGIDGMYEARRTEAETSFAGYVFNRSELSQRAAFQSEAVLAGGHISETGNITLFTALEPDVRTGHSREFHELYVVSQGEVTPSTAVFYGRDHAPDSSDLMRATEGTQPHRFPPEYSALAGGSLTFGGIHSVAWKNELRTVAGAVSEASDGSFVGAAFGHWNDTSCASQVQESAISMRAGVIQNGSIKDSNLVDGSTIGGSSIPTNLYLAIDQQKVAIKRLFNRSMVALDFFYGAVGTLAVNSLEAGMCYVGASTGANVDFYNRVSTEEVDSLVSYLSLRHAAVMSDLGLSQGTMKSMQRAVADAFTQFDFMFAPTATHATIDGRIPTRASPLVLLGGLDDMMQPGAGLSSAYWDDMDLHPIAAARRRNGSAAWPPSWYSSGPSLSSLLQDSSSLQALVSRDSTRVADVLYQYVRLPGRPTPGKARMGFALDTAKVHVVQRTQFGVALEHQCLYELPQTQSDVGWMRKPRALTCLANNDFAGTSWNPVVGGEYVLVDQETGATISNPLLEDGIEVPANPWAQSSASRAQLHVFSSLPAPAAIVRMQSRSRLDSGKHSNSTRLFIGKTSQSSVGLHRTPFASIAIGSFTAVPVGMSSLYSAGGLDRLATAETDTIVDPARAGVSPAVARWIGAHGLHSAAFGRWTPPVDVTAEMVVVLCQFVLDNGTVTGIEFRCDDGLVTEELLVSRGFNSQTRRGKWSSPRRLWKGTVSSGLADVLAGGSNSLEALRLAERRGWLQSQAEMPPCVDSILYASRAGAVIGRQSWISCENSSRTVMANHVELAAEWPPHLQPRSINLDWFDFGSSRLQMRTVSIWPVPTAVLPEGYTISPFLDLNTSLLSYVYHSMYGSNVAQLHFGSVEGSVDGFTVSKEAVLPVPTIAPVGQQDGAAGYTATDATDRLNGTVFHPLAQSKEAPFGLDFQGSNGTVHVSDTAEISSYLVSAGWQALLLPSQVRSPSVWAAGHNFSSAAFNSAFDSADSIEADAPHNVLRVWMNSSAARLEVAEQLRLPSMLHTGCDNDMDDRDNPAYINRPVCLTNGSVSSNERNRIQRLQSHMGDLAEIGVKSYVGVPPRLSLESRCTCSLTSADGLLSFKDNVSCSSPISDAVATVAGSSVYLHGSTVLVGASTAVIQHQQGPAYLPLSVPSSFPVVATVLVQQLEPLAMRVVSQEQAALLFPFEVEVFPPGGSIGPDNDRSDFLANPTPSGWSASDWRNAVAAADASIASNSIQGRPVKAASAEFYPALYLRCTFDGSIPTPFSPLCGTPAPERADDGSLVPWVVRVSVADAEQSSPALDSATWNVTISARAFAGGVPFATFNDRIGSPVSLGAASALSRSMVPLFAPSPGVQISAIAAALQDCSAYYSAAGVLADCGTIRDPLDAARRASFCSFRCKRQTAVLFGPRNSTCDSISGTWSRGTAICVDAYTSPPGYPGISTCSLRASVSWSPPAPLAVPSHAEIVALAANTSGLAVPLSSADSRTIAKLRARPTGSYVVGVQFLRDSLPVELAEAWALLYESESVSEPGANEAMRTELSGVWQLLGSVRVSPANPLDTIPTRLQLEGFRSIGTARSSLQYDGSSGLLGLPGVAIPVPAGIQLRIVLASSNAFATSNASLPSPAIELDEAGCGFVDVRVNVSASTQTESYSGRSEDPDLSTLIPLTREPSESTPILLSTNRYTVRFSLGFQARPAAQETVSVNCSVRGGHRPSDGEQIVYVSPSTAIVDRSTYDYALALLSSTLSSSREAVALEFEVSMVYEPRAWVATQIDASILCTVYSSVGQFRRLSDKAAASNRRAQEGLSYVYQDVYSAMVPIRVVGTLIPFFQDVLIWRPAVVASQFGFGFQSAWVESGVARPRISDVYDFNSDGVYTPSDFATMQMTQLQQADAVPFGPTARQSVAQSTLRLATVLASRHPRLGALTVSVSGETDMIVVGDESQRMEDGPHFAPGVKVFVGDVEATVLAVSSDGRFLRIRTPSFSDACGSNGEQCIGPSAYRSIRIENPPVVLMDVLERLPKWRDPLLRYEWPESVVPCLVAELEHEDVAAASNATVCDPNIAVFDDMASLGFWRDVSLDALVAVGAVSAQGDAGILDATQPISFDAAIGATISCPRDCPGLREGEQLAFPTVPGSSVDPTSATLSSSRSARELTVSMSHDAWALALSTDGGPQFLPQRGAPQPDEYLQGFYYTAYCAGYANDTTVCLTPATADLCAFGVGDECRPCFEGALCPGGYRAWSQPGYYSPSEPAGVVRCAPPSMQRCLNWTLGATLCGEGYLQGSAGCRACDQGYFMFADGACYKCPSGEGGAKLLRPLGILIGIMIVLALIFFGIVYLATMSSGGTLIGGLKAAGELVLWMVGALQVVAQTGRSASVHLPSYLRTMLRGLSILQFDLSGVYIHPDCIDARPFSMEIFTFMGALMILACILITLWLRSGGTTRQRDKRASTRQLNAKALSSLVFSYLANSQSESKRQLFSLVSSGGIRASDNPMRRLQAKPGQDSTSDEEHEVLPVRSGGDLDAELDANAADRRRAPKLSRSLKDSTGLKAGRGSAATGTAQAHAVAGGASSRTESSKTRKTALRAKFRAAILKVAAERSSSRALQAQRYDRKRAFQSKEKGDTYEGEYTNLAYTLVPKLRRISFLLAFLLYAIFTNTALSTIDCVRVVEERLVFVAEDSTNSSTAGADSQVKEAVPQLQQVVEERLVLASNSFFECYAGDHLMAGILAWVVLAGFSVFLPIFLLIWASRRIHTIMRRLGDMRRKRQYLQASIAIWEQFSLAGACAYFWTCGGGANCCYPQCCPDSAVCREYGCGAQIPLDGRVVFRNRYSAGSMTGAGGSASSLVSSHGSEASVASRSQAAAPALVPALPPASPGRIIMQSKLQKPDSGLTSKSDSKSGVSSPAGSRQSAAAQRLNPLAAFAGAGASPGAGSRGAAQITPPAEKSPSRQSRKQRRGTLALGANLHMASSEKLAAVFYDLSAAARAELLLDESREVRKEASLKRMANSDYRPSHFYVHCMDLGILAVLALMAVFWKNPSTPLEAFGRTSISVCFLVGFAAFVVFKSPFFIVDSWKGPVKALALCIAAASEVLSTGIYCREELGWDGFDDGTIARFAVALFSMSIIMFVLLIYAFFSVVARYGRLETAGLVDEDGDVTEPSSSAAAARRGERPGGLAELFGVLGAPCCAIGTEAVISDRNYKLQAAAKEANDIHEGPDQEGWDGRRRKSVDADPLVTLGRASSRAILLQQQQRGQGNEGSRGGSSRWRALRSGVTGTAALRALGPQPEAPARPSVPSDPKEDRKRAKSTGLVKIKGRGSYRTVYYYNSRGSTDFAGAPAGSSGKQRATSRGRIRRPVVRPALSTGYRVKQPVMGAEEV